jgi:C_GCAxxG_C_C family probable redox protein
MEKQKEALLRFNQQGANCAQSVLATFAAEHRLDEKQALNLAACFGAGIGRMGFTCGAVSGACMVLGLRHGPDMENGMDGRTRVYGKVQDFTARFRERFGHLDCAALTGCDLTAASGRKTFAERGLHAGLCSGLVAGAVEILEEMRG